MEMEIIMGWTLEIDIEMDRRFQEGWGEHAPR